MYEADDPRSPCIVGAGLALAGRLKSAPMGASGRVCSAGSCSWLNVDVGYTGGRVEAVGLDASVTEGALAPSQSIKTRNPKRATMTEIIRPRVL